MAEKSKGKWAESAATYRPGSTSARGDAKATRPWHVPATEAGQPVDTESPSGTLAWARTLPAANLDADPEQPRRDFDEAALAELADSIRSQGVLQPLIVRRDPATSGRYIVVAGERRLRAARLAGLSEIPCMVLAGDSLREARLAQLAENLQREDLAPMEEALAIVRLADVDQLSQEDLARRLGKSPAYISRIFSVSRISADDYELLSTSKPSMSVLYEFAHLAGDELLRAKAIELVLSGATVRDLEALRSGGAAGRPAKGSKAAPKRGRPMKSMARAEALRRALRSLGPPTDVDTTELRAIADAQVALARWTAAAAGGDDGLAEAAEQFVDRLSRSSGARPSTREGTAGRAGRKAPTTRRR